MKSIKYLNILWLAAVVLSTLGGCSKPKTIPDDTLSDIFADMYVFNAYSNRTKLDFDSVDIYEPILNNYGYTSKDFVYTLGDYTKRKSARMSGILDNAISKLDKRHEGLSAEIKILDTIDSLATEISKEVVYTDSLIRATKIADTAKLKVRMPAEPEGKYEITYYYHHDSLDKNENLTNTHRIVNARNHSIKNATQRIRSRNRTKYNTTLETVSHAKDLEIVFGNYPDDAKKKIDFTVDSLVIVYYPPIEKAREKLYRTYIDYRLLVNDKEYYEYYDMPADSSTLHILPPLLPPARDSIVQ